MNRFLRPQGLAALVLALGAAWLPATCNAQDIPTGAWKGTIGQASVVVCFTEYRQAQYYYLRHRRNIPLVPPQGAEPQNDTPQAIAQAWKAGEFRLEEPVPGAEEEGRVSGRWLLQATSATQITGTWTAPNNGKALPISLHRATPARSTQGAGDCDPAFYEPILAAIRLKHAPATLGSRAYQTASSDEATTLQVPADLPQAKALSAVDTWAWLQGGEKSLIAHTGKSGQPIASGLMRLIKQRHPRNEDGDDCREVLDHMSVKPPYPSMQGLVFSTGFFHAMRACNDEVPLTWKQLWPYLSAQGRKVAELFQR